MEHLEGKFNFWCFLFGHAWTKTPHGNTACPRCGEAFIKDEEDYEEEWQMN